MTPVEIIIASSLAAAPALLGLFLGLAVAHMYEHWIVLRSQLSWFQKDFDEDTLSRQMLKIYSFWVMVFALLGGFAAGAYVQSTLDLLSYLR